MILVGWPRQLVCRTGITPSSSAGSRVLITMLVLHYIEKTIMLRPSLFSGTRVVLWRLTFGLELDVEKNYEDLEEKWTSAACLLSSISRESSSSTRSVNTPWENLKWVAALLTPAATTVRLLTFTLTFLDLLHVSPLYLQICLPRCTLRRVHCRTRTPSPVAAAPTSRPSADADTAGIHAGQQSAEHQAAALCVIIDRGIKFRRRCPEDAAAPSFLRYRHGSLAPMSSLRLYRNIRVAPNYAARDASSWNCPRPILSHWKAARHLWHWPICDRARWVSIFMVMCVLGMLFTFIDMDVLLEFLLKKSNCFLLYRLARVISSLSSATQVVSIVDQLEASCLALK